jgi:hypothetical protein
MAKNSEATLLLRIKTEGENLLSKLKGALTDIRTWAAAAFAALTSGAAVMAFREAEAATNKLNQSLVNNGIYTKALSADYEKIAKDLQGVTAFEDDAIKAAMAQMQAYLGQTKITKELMTATLDLAAAKKIDLSTAAEMVGKSIGTGTNALGRQGIELDKNASKSERMSKVLEGLNTQFGGQAEVTAKGYGALDQMKNAVGDLLEIVGEKLAPFVIRGAQAITQFATAISSNETVIFYFEMALQTIAKVLSGMKFQVLVAKDALQALFTGLYNAVTALASGELKRALTSFADAFDDMPKKIADRYQDMKDELLVIDDIYVKQKLAKQEEEMRNLRRSQDRKAEIERKGAIDEDEFFRARSEKEIANEITKQRLKSDETLRGLNARIEAEKDETKKLQLEWQKRKFLDEEFAADEKSRAGVAHDFIKALGVKRVDLFMNMLDDLSGMQNSKNKVMVGVGKAAAIANIAINTANAAMGAHAALDSIPVVGPGLGIAAAGSIIAMGAEKSAGVAGIQLAEGGVVKATPGGVHAVIGEGGRDEAVIPLPRNGSLMGTTVNLIVNGGMLGDAQQRREFTKVLDEELFKMRQANESLAFDRGVV